jgi:hypothetical protein
MSTSARRFHDKQLGSGHTQNKQFVRPVLAEALSVILPAWEDTLLLRMCLHSGQPARQAWEEWQRNGLGSTFLGDHRSVRNMRPLFFDAVRREGFEIDTLSQTYLRSAYLREELRSRIFRRILRDILQRFVESK